ncbi:MAG: hypothetical protein IJ647_02465 [Prevotella sp.]|nr:hypothetical protein [Prevotella sp.]
MYNKLSFSYQPKLYLTIFILALYIFFQSIWENIFGEYVINPFLSKFEDNVISVLFILSLLVWKWTITFHRRHNRKKTYLFWYLLALLFWTYYRFFSHQFEQMPIGLFPKMYYIDFVLILAIGDAIIICWPKDKTKPKFEGGFFIDQPISHSNQDLLGRTHLANDAIIKLLNTDTSEQAFTFGITAPWGNGKSSFMALMTEKIRERYSDKCLIIEFNPWKFTDQANLTTAFFRELSKATLPIDNSLSRDIVMYADMLSSLDIPYLKPLKSVMTYINGAPSISILSKKIHEALKTRHQKIVVFIDDIDRLTSNELVETIKLIRNSSNFPYLYFVVSYDKEYLQKSLNESLPQSVNKYEEKIFQQEYPLPECNIDSIQNLIYNNLRIFLNEDDLKYIHGFLKRSDFHRKMDYTLIQNIRDVVRLLNGFIASYEILKSEIDIIDLLNLELLKLKFLNVYRLIENYRDAVFYIEQRTCLLYSEEHHSKKSEELFNTGMRLDLLKYINEHKEHLHLSDNSIMQVTSLLRQLFPDYPYAKTSRKRINHISSINRYFNLNILESEISEKDFLDLWEQPINRIKEIFSQWVINKSQSLCVYLDEIDPVKKEDIQKVISLMFYVGAVSPRWHNDTQEINEKIKKLADCNPNRQYTNDDLSFIAESLSTNGSNPFIENYLRELDYNKIEWTYPLSRNWINDIRVNLFRSFLEKHPTDMKQVIRCFYGTTDTQWVKTDENSYIRKFVQQPQKIALMKEYVIEHIDQFLSNIISYYIPNIQQRYGLSDLPKTLWGTWEYFELFLESMSEPNNMEKEFLEFYKKYKEAGLSDQIPFDFKCIAIKA